MRKKATFASIAYFCQLLITWHVKYYVRRVIWLLFSDRQTTDQADLQEEMYGIFSDADDIRSQWFAHQRKNKKKTAEV